MPTASTISHQWIKPSNGCTPSVDTWSNQLGSKPSKRETTWAGQCWLNATSKSTTLRQLKPQRGIWTKQERKFGPPKLRGNCWKHSTPPTSLARRCTRCTPKRTWYAKPCSLTKQASSPSNLFVATSTSWLWWKLTATPSLSSPWRIARTPRWYKHTMHSCSNSNELALSLRNMSLTMRFWKHEKSHSWQVQIGYGIGATRLPQTLCSRGSHTQLQSPLPQHLSWCSP